MVKLKSLENEKIVSGNPEIDPPPFTANSVDYKPIVRIEHNLQKQLKLI